MITLKADNRQLTKNADFSYLSNNYSSGVSSVVVLNGGDFSADDYILLGEFGSETSETAQIDSVSTNTLTLKSATSFAHAESTKVTVLPYNQVKFYQTAAATFDSNENFLGTIGIQADSIHTKYEDTTNTSGYGWFVFYNATTAKATTNSNAIPYSDFSANSVKKIIDDFFSQLNNEEMRLITAKDAFRWLNEAYTIAQNELNLVNSQYTVEDIFQVTTSDGTSEYSLPDDFSELISVNANSDGDEIPNISIRNIVYYKNTATSTNLKYYIRYNKIGFVPTPSTSNTYDIYYKKKTATLSSYYENINLPNNNYFFLVEYMLYKASNKIHRLNGKQHHGNFRAGINTMKITSHKQDAKLDQWDVDDYTTV